MFLASHLTRLLGAALVGVVLCLTNVAASRASEANQVTVIATDFALELPSSLPSGLTTFRLVNRGSQSHHLSVMRLDSGKTASDGFAALAKVGHGVRPSWMHPVGGPNAPMLGGESRATLVLEPGNYMAFCEIPGPTTMPHYMKGMVKPFVVTSPSRTASLPRADLTIEMTDFDFVLSHPLTHGRHTIAVTNVASQSHMLVIRRFPSGQAAGQRTKEFLAWVHDPNNTPAPGDAAGGITEIAPGANVVMSGDFSPGTYVLLCFVADTKDGKPHFMHGMQKEIIVQ
jgi:hypothetical protein